LDGLDSGVVACQHGPPGMATSTATTTTAAGSTTATTGLFATTGAPGSLGRQANVVSGSRGTKEHMLNHRPSARTWPLSQHIHLA